MDKKQSKGSINQSDLGVERARPKETFGKYLDHDSSDSGIEDREGILKRVRELLNSQMVAVVGSWMEDKPYLNLVGFTVTEDMSEILFSTSRTTRKYKNMMKDPHVALLMDNRSQSECDFSQATVVSVMGKVREIVGPEKAELVRLYLEKLPFLKDFVSSENCALLACRVRTYQLVTQFQRVLEVDMDAQ